MTGHFARSARHIAEVTGAESREWLKELERMDKQRTYFFCVNRFTFPAVKA